MDDLVFVHGTWGRAQPWHLPDSALRAEAEARGFTVHDFLWSGVLAGVPSDLPGDPRETTSGADSGLLLPWLDAGEKLRLFCLTHELIRPCVLSHSHGLQVVAFACIRGQHWSTAVSVSGPIRRDMLRARRIAQGRIASWVQFSDPTARSDRTILEGEWFDGGGPGATFELPEGSTVPTPGSGHSGLVNDPPLRAKYDFWTRLPAAAV